MTDPLGHQDISRHWLYTSRHCIETIIIALENGLEIMKIIYMLYNGLGGYISECN